MVEPAGAGGSDDPATPATPEPPAAPSIDERLNWDPEANGELAEDLQSVPLTELGAYREHVAQEASQAAEQRFTERQRQAEEARQARDRDLAGQRELAQYADALDKRIEGDDEADSKAAIAERAANRDRYDRGIAASVDVRTAEQDRAAIERHYAPLTAGLVTAGHQALYEAFPDLLPKHSNNPLLASLEYGRELGNADALERGRDEGARDERITLGADGAPALRPGVSPGSPFEKIDLSKPGAGRDLFRAASESGSKR